MPDQKKTEAAEDQINAELIKQVDATQQTPRGNVFSEEEEGNGAPGEGPPPLPN